MRCPICASRLRRRPPGVGVAVQGVVKLCARHGVPFVPADTARAVRRCAASRGRRRHRSVASQSSPQRRYSNQRDGRARRHQSRNHPSGGAVRLLLRTGSVQPAGVLDWRNVAENSGGAHCLKYGFTVHHVLEVEAVMPDGGSCISAARSPIRPDRSARPPRRLRRDDRIATRITVRISGGLKRTDAARGVRHDRRRRRRRVGHHRRRHHSGSRRNDGRARDSRRRGRGPSQFPRR